MSQPKNDYALWINKILENKQANAANAKKYVLNLNRYTQIKFNYFSNYILLIRICLINKSADHDE